MNPEHYVTSLLRTGKQSFTLDEMAESLAVSRNYARVALHRLIHAGTIFSPSRGFYVIIPPQHHAFGCIPAEELVPLWTQHLGVDYYVGLLSAAAYHGATHQKPAQFQIISTKRKPHPFIFGKIEILWIYKKSLTDLPYMRKVVSTGYLHIATAELVALDLFAYPTRAGGINHSATVIAELMEAIDPHKLAALAQAHDLCYQLQRFAYVLEKVDVMDEEKKASILEVLASFLLGRMPHYVALAPEMGVSGYPRCKKWKIIENSTVESDL